MAACIWPWVLKSAGLGWEWFSFEKHPDLVKDASDSFYSWLSFCLLSNFTYSTVPARLFAENDNNESPKPGVLSVYNLYEQYYSI